MRPNRAFVAIRSLPEQGQPLPPWTVWGFPSQAALAAYLDTIRGSRRFEFLGERFWSGCIAEATDEAKRAAT